MKKKSQKTVKNKKLTADDFIKCIDLYFYKETLPNGKRTSQANFIDFVTTYLGNTFYFVGKGKNRGKELPYQFAGLKKVLQTYLAQKQDNNIAKRTSINILDEFDPEFEFDDGDYEVLQPYQLLPGQEYKALVISDIHIPYHDINVLKTAIHYGKKEGVNVVILNGDILDMHGGSSKFVRIPHKKNLMQEIEDGRRFIAQLRKIFPSEKILFKVGNHEARFDDYIMRKCPELWNMDILNLRDALQLKSHNVEFVASSQTIIAGKLMIAHGHEWGGGGGGINAARAMFLKANYNLLIGHFHRTQDFTFRNAMDETHAVFVNGCLCHLRPEYLPNNNWNHGFSIVEVKKSGKFIVYNKRIVDGMVC